MHLSICPLGHHVICCQKMRHSHLARSGFDCCLDGWQNNIYPGSLCGTKPRASPWWYHLGAWEDVSEARWLCTCCGVTRTRTGSCLTQYWLWYGDDLTRKLHPVVLSGYKLTLRTRSSDGPLMGFRTWYSDISRISMPQVMPSKLWRYFEIYLIPLAKTRAQAKKQWIGLWVCTDIWFGRIWITPCNFRAEEKMYWTAWTAWLRGT